MNCIVAYEMFSLIKDSYQRKKIDPPSVRKVLMQGVCVYTVTTIFATWFALEVPWPPYSVSDAGTSIWSSMEGGVFSTTGTLALSIVVLSPPTLYVLYVAFTIWWKELLPRSGRTRAISLYFIRILFVFFAFYYPGIVLRSLLLEDG